MIRIINKIDFYQYLENKLVILYSGLDKINE